MPDAPGIVTTGLGDNTSRETKPDFDSGKGYYWMKATKEAMKTPGLRESMPRKPRRTLAEHSFWGQVDRRLSRQTFATGFAFDRDGKLIREES